MKNSKIKSILVALALISFSVLFAETVILREGKSIKGKVLSQNNQIITLMVGKDKRIIQKHDVLKVVYKDISLDEEQKIRMQEELKRQIDVQRHEEERKNREAAEKNMAKEALVKKAEEEKLLKEKERLYYLVTFSGGQSLTVKFMSSRNTDRANEQIFYAKTDYGFMHFFPDDFGDIAMIRTDKGQRKISPEEMLAVKKENYVEGFIYLVSGEVIEGKIRKKSGESVWIDSTKGNLLITASEVIFPKITPRENFRQGIFLEKGDWGKFHFNDGQIIEGKLLSVEKYNLIIETQYGYLEMDPSYLIAAEKK